MKWLSLLLLLVALSMVYAKRSFILTAPKSFDMGKTETFLLHLYDVKDSGTVKIRLVNNTGDEPYSEVTVPIQDGQSTSVELPVPSHLPRNARRAKLEVDGLIGDYRINKSQEVILRDRRPLVIINTDKPLYKAGQTVNIRVLITDTELRPHKEAKIGELIISDSNRIRIAQWINASFSNGLIHKKLPIPEEPVLGKWYIDVKVDEHFYTRTFEVKEYVLPSFHVKVTPPPYLPFYAKNATWEVCAKYSYGKPVKGELLTRLSQPRYYWQKNSPYSENTTKVKGCTSVTMSLEELRNGARYYPVYSLEFYAEVTEEGTGTKMNATSTITPTLSPYTINTVGQQPRYFRPGIPLSVMMTATAPDSKPIPNELIQICKETSRKKWNSINMATNNAKLCKNYTTDENGNIYFTIPPQDPNTVFLVIMVEAAIWEPITINGYKVEKPSRFFTLSPWYSHSGSHIQFQTTPTMNCSVIGPNIKASIPFHITYNELGIKKMHYQIMSRGDIVGYGDFDIKLEPNSDQADETYLPDDPTAMCAESSLQWENDVKTAKYLSKNYLFFNFDDKMTPRTRILLYTVMDDGDIIADSISYETELCFANQVKLRFVEEKQSPGAKATIHLMAEPHSLCSVGIVDKSMYILHKEDLLTGSQVGRSLLHLDTTHYSYPDQKTPDFTYCSKKETGYPSSGFFDAISAFADNGGLVFSDLPLETRPCQPLATSGCHPYPPVPYHSEYRPPGQPQSSSSDDLIMEVSGESGIRGIPGSPAPPPPPPSQVVTIRTEFPETWLFKLYTVGEEGSLKMKQKMPDSITEWQGQAVCIQPDKGLGFSAPTSIVAFQPFFASLTLPYSVVRNEVIPIVVTVFNYLKDCLPIKVHLNQTEQFELYNGTLTRSICICRDDSETMYFHVRPVKLGVMNVTVTAKTSGDKDICGNFDVALDVRRSDTLTKPLLVEAEGFMVEKVFNSYFCLPDETHESYKTIHLLKLPETHRYIQDSARAYSSATGDLMGPTWEGIDDLVRMPTGCGEQNMVGLVPNIVVLDYLTATKKLEEDLRVQAVNHIREGYIQQQKYRHPDGSYSAFGAIDKEGSIWLTAFVIRTFASARRYINIDERSLEESRKWVLSRQRGIGCFPLVGTVHNKAMKGGVSREDRTTSTLTAYILIAMLESGEMDEKAVHSAIMCIRAKHHPTNYSTSLFAYATALAKHNSSSEYLERLMSVAEKDDDGSLYWEDKDRSIAVETASYVILTLLKSERKEAFEKVASIAKWLIKQRNSYGGFYSTQDTVMALQALGKYGSIITQESPKVEISVTTPKIHETFHVNPENELLMQRTNLKMEEQSETSVEITANGAGCALVQTSFRYNLAMPEPSEDFVLVVVTQRKSEGACEDAEILICASYNHPDGSNMAIIEVKMVTGYSPIIDTVKELLKSESLGIKRYEFKEDTNILYLYIDTLTQNITCFVFDVTQEIKVLDVKPSNAKVYDYYDEGKSVSVPYSIKDTCT